MISTKNIILQSDENLEFSVGTDLMIDLPFIPADELWLWNNSEFSAKFARANNDMREGRGIPVDNLAAYFESL